MQIGGCIDRPTERTRPLQDAIKAGSFKTRVGKIGHLTERGVDRKPSASSQIQTVKSPPGCDQVDLEVLAVNSRF